MGSSFPPSPLTSNPLTTSFLCVVECILDLSVKLYLYRNVCNAIKESALPLKGVEIILQLCLSQARQVKGPRGQKQTGRIKPTSGIALVQGLTCTQHEVSNL